VIRDPITVAPDMTIRQVIELTRSKASRRAGGAGRQGRGHRHASRPALRSQTRRAGINGHDSEGAPGTVPKNAPKDEVLLLLHKHRIEKCWW